MIPRGHKFHRKTYFARIIEHKARHAVGIRHATHSFYRLIYGINCVLPVYYKIIYHFRYEKKNDSTMTGAFFNEIYLKTNCTSTFVDMQLGISLERIRGNSTGI